MTSHAVQILHVGFLYLIIKCLSQSNYVTKTLYDVILVKFRPKNPQILESNKEKAQNWKTSPNNFKFSKVNCIAF